MSQVLEQPMTPSPHITPPTPLSPTEPLGSLGCVDKASRTKRSPATPDNYPTVVTDTPASSPPRRPLMRRIRPQLVLENTGSVARDHLALERTFLAYVRTSLGVATMGVALVQLFVISTNVTSDAITPSTLQLRAFGRPLGAVTIILGLLLLVLGSIRFFTVQAALVKGKFPVARIVVAGVTLSLSAVVILVFSILISRRR